MRQQGVLEAQVPLIRSAPAADAHIQHMEVGGYWLHSSPEAALKKLLASGSGSVYYLGQVFRSGEQGALHRPEFTMLEWYMLGYDTAAITVQLAELLDAVSLNMPPPQLLDYGEAFKHQVGIDHSCEDAASWREAAAAKGVNCDGCDSSSWRDLMLSHCVIPQLGHNRPAILYGFPHDQSLQARPLPGSEDRDDRFELIVHGVEIADGCRELNDLEQLHHRQAKPDPMLVQALQQGLPDCTGVALGVDRLLAVMQHRRHGCAIKLDTTFAWKDDGSPP